MRASSVRPVLGIVAISGIAMGVSLVSHPASAMRALQVATGTITTTPGGSGAATPGVTATVVSTVGGVTGTTTPVATTGVPLAAQPVYGSPGHALPHRAVALVSIGGHVAPRPAVLRVQRETVVVWHTSNRSFRVVSATANWHFGAAVRPGKNAYALMLHRGTFRYRVNGSHSATGTIVVR